MALYLSADFGTGSVRVSVFDGDAQAMIGIEKAAYPTVYPQMGWAEQNPNDWWDAFEQATGRLLGKIGRTDVATITVATTASTVAIVRDDGTPLAPALLWMDARAAEQAARTATVDHPNLAYAGGSDAAEWLVPKAMWLREHQPEVYAQAARIVEAQDFINHRLTGEWVGSQLNATCKWNVDGRQATLPADLYALLGIPELASKLPQRIVAVGEIVGTVQPHVAERIGLTGHPTVVQGGIDAHVATLGAGVTGNEELLITAGTSIAMINQSTDRHDVPGVWGPYPEALLPGRWLTEIGVVSAGSVLEWLAARMFGLDADGHKALMAEAAGLPPHGTGLLTLDYFMGNRTPYRDANLRGGILGLTLGHDRPHLYRSAVEAVAYATRNAIEALNTDTRRMQRFVVGGGIRHNPLWLQVTADVLQAPLVMTREANHTLLAGAVAGAYASGAFASLDEASQAWVHFEHEIEPHPATRDAYEVGFQTYRDATAAAGPTLNALAARSVEGDAS